MGVIGALTCSPVQDASRGAGADGPQKGTSGISPQPSASPPSNSGPGRNKQLLSLQAQSSMKKVEEEGGGWEWGWHLSEPRLLLRVFEGYKCGYNHAVSQVQVENEVALKLLS